MYLSPFDNIIAAEGAIVVADGNALRALNAALDHHSLRRQQKAWQPPNVVTWASFLSRQFAADTLARVDADNVDFALSTDQQRVLWQAVIGADDLLDMRAPEQAAPLAVEAWQLQHLWNLPNAVNATFASADVAAFARWSAAYRARTESLRVTDLARLLGRYADVGGALQASLAHGFIDPAPRLREWLSHSTAPAPALVQTNTQRATAHVFRDRESELAASISWAAECAAADPDGRVVVVLDSLEEHEQLVRRCCQDVFGSVAAGAAKPYFLGLAERAMVAPTMRFAMLLLELGSLAPWDALSELIRHPLLKGAAQEASMRALFDAELRALERYELPLELVTSLLATSTRCPQLAVVLRGIGATHRGLPRRQTMSGWLQHFDACLSAGGWPGDGELDVERASIVNLWNEIGDRLNALDAVLAPVTRGEALVLLRRTMSESNLRAQSAGAGVFVLPPEHALLVEPTHLWLAGCESQLLLRRSHMSPLLSLEHQRKAGLPGSDPARELARAKRVLTHLHAVRGQAHVSYAMSDGELRFSPSPLLPQLNHATAAAPGSTTPTSWTQIRARMEFISDDYGPPLRVTDNVGGGVALLTAQAACPFRGFARHRLASTVVEEPTPGISARAKGILVHRILARVWAEFRDRASLAALLPEIRDRQIAAAIHGELNALPFETEIEREIHLIERERLFALITHWLDFEMNEGEDFVVVGREQRVETHFAGLKLVTRIDRVDQLSDGSVVLIDYKTGQCSTRDWEPPRMDQPQLPFYALTAPFSRISAIAYAAVERMRPRLLVASSTADTEEWLTKLAAWRTDLEGLSVEIRDGLATVTPKRGLVTCRYCEQTLFCRRHETLQSDAGCDAGDDDQRDD